MMDATDMLVLMALISPIYLALFGIYQKIGNYDAVCIQFMQHIKGEAHAN